MQIVRRVQFAPLSVRIFVFTSRQSVRSMFAHRTSDRITISFSVLVKLADRKEETTLGVADFLFDSVDRNEITLLSLLQ